MEPDKKIVIFYVLEVLTKFSDENHLLTYNDIQNKIVELHNVKPNAKTIASNINTLISVGYEITKNGKNGCYLSCREFEQGELLYLIDAINSSVYIPAKQAKELIDKLTKSISIYEKPKYNTIHKVDTIARSKNREMFYVIEVLNEAISQGKKVKFNYNEYSSKKEMQPRFKGKQFLISPYFMVNSRGRYYLVCNYDKYNDISNYKIECISNISIVDEPIKPISTLDNSEAISKENYINEHIYMTFGKSVDTTIKVENPKYINELIDWFGDTFQVANPVNSESIVRLRVNEQALIYWALQYGEHFEILKPAETREKIKEQIEILNKKYERKE